MMWGKDLKVLMPFYNVEDLDPYFHLVKSLRNYCSEIYIPYVTGRVKESWISDFSFQKLDVEKIRKNKSLELLLSRKRIFKQLEKMSFNVFFVLSELWTLEFSSFFSRKLKIPFVVWLRGDHRRVREARKINWFKRLLATYLEVKYLNQAEFVIPNCMSLYEKLEKWGVNKSKITKPVYNGVDTEVFKPMEVVRSDEFTVAYAGRICYEKRVIELLEIAKKLRDIRFIIAGPKTINVAFPDNVEYLGKLPFEEMPKFYNMADLIVLPSLTEGFPSVILEAYACGKPVLVAEEAFPKELRVFGIVANLNDFEQKIRELQKADLKNIGIEARNYVKENFGWKQYEESIKAYLEKAIYKRESL